ncbi:dihydrofolate reductase-like domain-containing protein [Spinellus fusiger]|nr:dihydrofolate reductase-like domain-containing protein [Spinellus fusiger]
MDRDIYQDARVFLDKVYETKEELVERPFVTLTYAQSLDGKIAIKGQQLLLSGKESMAMTHRLRVLHDGIMVGIGTALIDNPQLNARYLSPEDPLLKNQPQPIVLDPRLEYPLTGKLLSNFKQGTGKQPWLVTWFNDIARKTVLQEAGALVISINVLDGARPSLSTVLQVLRQHGIESLMVEGGAQIIQSFLLSGHVDQLIVTTAPTLVGPQGVSVTGDSTAPVLLPTLNQSVIYQQFGRDMVVATTLSH